MGFYCKKVQNAADAGLSRILPILQNIMISRSVYSFFSLFLNRIHSYTSTYGYDMIICTYIRSYDHKYENRSFS